MTKFIASLFFPISGVLFLLALSLLVWKKKPRLAYAAVLLAALVLLAMSTSPVSSLVLGPLERRYPPLTPAKELQNYKWIVVLGGGNIPDPALDLNSRLTAASHARLLEGVILQRQLPGSKLLLSGGVTSGAISEARSMADVAAALGLEPAAMQLEEKSKNTAEQAETIKAIIGKDPFVLVTSAAHMPRAMALFEHQGLHPLAAPTDRHVSDLKQIGLAELSPRAAWLAETEMGFYEYIGTAWAWLTGADIASFLQR